MGRRGFVDEVPFTFRKDIIVVKARLNHDTTLREFIFDTGAFNSKVEQGLAERLGMPTVATKTNSTAQGISKEIAVGRLDSLTLGSTPFYKISAGKVAYAEGSASPCLAPHGLIGANLIQLAHWRIDYPNRLLAFSDEPFAPLPELPTIRIPFSTPVLSGTPKIDLQLQGRTVENVLFDVGYNGGLVLPMELAGHFEGKVLHHLADRSTSGIYGSNTDTLLVKKLRLQLGKGTEGWEVPVEFSSIGKVLLGNALLRHFTVLLDYQANEIVLQQQGPIHHEPLHAFVPGILNDSLWVVDRVPVGQQVLQLGDTLTAINGQRPGGLFNGFCDYFFGVRPLLEGDTLRLQRPDGSSLKLTRN